MGILLLLVFLPSLSAWYLALYPTIRGLPLSSLEVGGGMGLAVLGLVLPLLRWKSKGRIHALAPSFAYLIFSVSLPYCLGLLLSIISQHRYALGAVHSLNLAVTIILPVVCGYFFLAPSKLSVPNILNIRSYY